MSLAHELIHELIHELFSRYRWRDFKAIALKSRQRSVLNATTYFLIYFLQTSVTSLTRAKFFVNMVLLWN